MTAARREAEARPAAAGNNRKEAEMVTTFVDAMWRARAIGVVVAALFCAPPGARPQLRT